MTLSEALDPSAVSTPPQVWFYQGHWYALSTASSWTGAEAEAQALGGHLATIDDAAENQWLNDTFQRFGQNLWIGQNDQAVEGAWVWSSGASSSFTNWWPGYPNNSSEDYAYLNPSNNGGSWFNASDTGLGSGARGIIEFTGADSDGDGVPDALDAQPNDPLNNWALRGAGVDGLFDTGDDVVSADARFALHRRHDGAADDRRRPVRRAGVAGRWALSLQRQYDAQGRGRQCARRQ